MARDRGNAVVYQNDDIAITATRVILNGRSYALDNVTTVQVAHRWAHPIVGCITVAIGLGLGGIGYWMRDTRLALVIGSVTLLVAGIVLIGLARRGSVVRLRTVEGRITLIPTASTAQARQLRDAISEILAHRP